MPDFRHLTNLEPLPSGEYDELDAKLIAALGPRGKIGLPYPTLVKSTQSLIDSGITGLYATWEGLRDIAGATGWQMSLQDFTKLPLLEE